MSRYYEEVLGIPFSNFPEIDIAAIAKDADTRVIVQLCKYILTSAVVGPNNTKYIPEIQLMSESDQKHVKAIIEEVKASNLARNKSKKRDSYDVLHRL